MLHTFRSLRIRQVAGRRTLLVTTVLCAGLPAMPALAHEGVEAVAADSGHDAERVVVTGKRRTRDASGFSNAAKASGQTIKLTTSQTQVRITQRELLEAAIPIGTFSNALANQPNILIPVSTSPIIGSDIILRGFTKSLLNVTVDGIPINLADNDAVYANQLLPLGLTGSIDLKPGAGSASTVGYSDFGGSIDVNSADPAKTFFLTTESGYGSFNEQKYGVTLNSGRILNDTTSFIVSYNNQRAGGFFDKGSDGQPTRTGEVPAYNQIAAKLVNNIGPGVLTGLISHTNEKFFTVLGATSGQIAEYGIAANVYTGPSNPATFWANQYKKENNTISYLDYTMPLGERVTLSERPYYWNYYSYTTSVPTAKPYSSRYLQESLLQDFRYGDITKASIALLPWWRIDTGLLADYSRFTISQPNAPLDARAPILGPASHISDNTTTIQPFVETHIDIGNRLTVTPGIKYSTISRSYRNQITYQGYNTTWRDALPSLGLNYIMAGSRSHPVLTLYANYTRSFEPPAFSQISTTAANFGLSPQYADSFEAGPMWDVGRWTGKLSLFDTHFLNYIQNITVYNAANPNGVVAYGNAGGATYQGMDFNNSFKLNRKVAFFANIGLVDAHFSNLSTPIPSAPKNTDAVGIRYQGEVIQAGASFQYNTGFYIQTLTNVFVKTTPAFISNVFVDYDLPVSIPHVESAVISLNIDNAFDRHYIVSGASYGGKTLYNYALPLNVFADLKIRFH